MNTKSFSRWEHELCYDVTWELHPFSHIAIHCCNILCENSQLKILHRNILITVYVVMREHIFKTCVVILKRPLQNHYTSLEDMLSRHLYLWMDHWQMESKGLLISKVNMSGSRASGECSKTKYFNLLITYR